MVKKYLLFTHVHARFVLKSLMKKLLFLFLIALSTKSLSAQMIVDAEMFKANPNQFMGKVVTIKNVIFKGSRIAPGSNGAAAVARPSKGKSQSVHCNPAPNFTLTHWTLGPNNDLCLQVEAKVKPMVDMCQVGGVVKSISFRCTPNMYVATRVEK